MERAKHSELGGLKQGKRKVGCANRMAAKVHAVVSARLDANVAAMDDGLAEARAVEWDPRAAKRRLRAVVSDINPASDLLAKNVGGSVLEGQRAHLRGRTGNERRRDR